MPRSDDDYMREILRMEKPLRAILPRFAPQPADLEDLLQETYSHLFSLPLERRAAVRNVQAFVITTARNVARDWIRHQQLMRIAGGIAQLPERAREVFTLRRVYGLSQKEIAAKLEISEGAVEQL